MKKILLSASVLLSLLPFTAIPQTGSSIWRGYNELEHRSSNGALYVHTEQTVERGTNLVQRDLYCFPSGSATQSLYVTHAELRSAWVPVRKLTVFWNDDGSVSTNDRPAEPSDGLLSFFQAGNQGARKWVDPSTGDTFRMVLYTAFFAKWPTNEYISQCYDGDDGAGIAWFFKSKPGLSDPWFVGMETALRPGDQKVVDAPLPMNEWWNYMGTDKMRGCGTNIWNQNWPAPVQLSAALSLESWNQTIVLRVAGLPGKEYRLERAGSVSEPMEVIALFTMPVEGEVSFPVMAEGTQGFYRMEAE